MKNKYCIAIACIALATQATAAITNADDYWKPLALDAERSVVVSHINEASEKSGGIERLIEDSEGDNANAKYQVAQMHLYGIYRFEKNLNKGIDLLHKAADLGSPEANLMLGKAYLGKYQSLLDGSAISIDKQKGLDMLTRSSDKNDPEAQYILGMSYIMGDGISQDYDLGMFWLTRSENNGNLDAFQARQDLIFKKTQNQKSFEYVQERVSGGNSNFLVELAKFYLDNASVVQNNRDKAIRLLKTAARLQVEAAVVLLNDLGIEYEIKNENFDW